VHYDCESFLSEGQAKKFFLFFFLSYMNRPTKAGSPASAYIKQGPEFRFT
jgi:hypothetical protein